MSSGGKSQITDCPGVPVTDYAQSFTGISGIIGRCWLYEAYPSVSTNYLYNQPIYQGWIWCAASRTESTQLEDGLRSTRASVSHHLDGTQLWKVALHVSKCLSDNKILNETLKHGRTLNFLFLPLYFQTIALFVKIQEKCVENNWYFKNHWLSSFWKQILINPN